MVAGNGIRHSTHTAIYNHKQILKGTFILGTNASGKTNLIRAIDFAQSIVLKGIKNTDYAKKYFRLDPSYKERPAVFQFDIFVQEHFYSYGFALSYVTGALEEEWLYQIDNPEQNFCVFLRSKNPNSEDFTISSDLTFAEQSQEVRFSIYKEDLSKSKIKPTQALSDIANRSPEDCLEFKPFKAVLKWFEDLVVVLPNSKDNGSTKFFDCDNNNKLKLENWLTYFDTGIVALSYKPIDFNKTLSILPQQDVDLLKTKLNKNLKQNGQSIFLQHQDSLLQIKNVEGVLLTYKVLFNHGNDLDLFEYNDESESVKRLFELITLLQKLLSNSVVIIDNLDRNLHTKIAQEFINKFYSLTEHNYSQLITTTYDLNILDLDLVCQDEIWFIERQADHSSKLFSLNKFNLLSDKTIEKDYLLGRFGAISIFRPESLESEDLDKSDKIGQSDKSKKL